MKKMYRQPVMLLAIVLLVFGATGAAGDEPTRTVTFWHSMTGGRFDAFREIFLDRFAAEYPPWTVEAQYVGRVRIAVRQRMTGPAGPPDLALVNRDDIPYLADSGLIYSMNELLGDKITDLGIDETLLRWLTYRGEVWGVPFCANTRVLFYNPDLIKDAGLSAPPASWSELTEFAEQATRDTDNDGKPDVWGLHLGDMPVTLRDFFFEAGGKIDLRPGSDEPVTEQAFTDAVGMMDDLRYRRNLLRGEHRADPLAAGFEQGTVAMEIDRIERAYSIALSGTPFGVAPIPAGKTHATGFSNSQVFVIGRRPNGTPQGALAFIRMFLDPAFHTKWVRASGYVPPTRAIRDSKQYKNLVSVWPWNQVAATTIPDARFVPLGLGSERVETALRRELSRTHERLVPSVEDGLAALKQTISSVSGKHSLPDGRPVTVRFAPSTVKLRPGENWRPFTTFTTDLDMAMNETESFQLVVETHRTDGVKVTDVKVDRPQSSPSAHLNLCKIDVLHIEDIEIDHPMVSDSAGPYPDVLVPWHGPESVTPEKPIRLWIRVFVDSDATPGIYHSTVRIETNDGRSTVAPLTLRVHEVRIPKTPRISATAGLNFDRLAARFGMDRHSAEFLKVADKYYDFLLNYRITPYRPPVKVGSPESRPYLEDPRVTSFVFPYDETDQTMSDTAATLRSWNLQDHAFFYVEDEPFYGMYARIIETGLRAYKLAPEFPYMMTTPPTKDFAGLVDIWCLHVGFRPISTPSSIGDIRNTVWNIEQARARGERIWWYTAGAVSPLPTLHIDDDAVAPRIMPWLQPLYGITGFLQWEVANWVNDDPYTEPLIPPFGNGEGLLIYPSRDRTDTTPIPSVRLELLRDGLEDYELLYMLGASIDIVKKQLGPVEWNYSGAVRMREYASRFIKSDARERAARQWVFFMAETDRDPNLFAQARRSLFAELASITVPPLALVATHPAAGSYTTDPTALVEVATEPESVVRINGVPRNSLQTGFIRVQVDLEPGPNRIEVSVEKNGNVKTITRTVYRTGNITEVNDRQPVRSSNGG